MFLPLPEAVGALALVEDVRLKLATLRLVGHAFFWRTRSPLGLTATSGQRFFQRFYGLKPFFNVFNGLFDVSAPNLYPTHPHKCYSQQIPNAK